MSWGTENTLGAPKMTENGRWSCLSHDSVYSQIGGFPYWLYNFILHTPVQIIKSYKPYVINHMSSVIHNLSSVFLLLTSVLCHLSSVIHQPTIYLISTHLCSILSELDSEDLHLVFIFNTEPLNLPLEKKYHLNGVQEVTVTDSFVSLDEDIRKCKEESYDECTFQKYYSALINKCQCMPFQIRLLQQQVLKLRAFALMKLRKNSSNVSFQKRLVWQTD